jgi:hypothetical protein
VLIRQLSAETLGGRCDTQVLQLGGVQAVRQSLNVLRDVENALSCLLDVMTEID